MMIVLNSFAKELAIKLIDSVTPFVNIISVDKLYLDTYHGKQNTSNSLERTLERYIRNNMMEGDNDSIFDDYLDILSINCKMPWFVIKKVREGKSPGFIGHDCDNFRSAWYSSTVCELDAVQVVADYILEGKFEESERYRSGAVLPALLLSHGFQIEDDEYLHDYFMSVYLFYGIYEELTSLHTSEAQLHRLKLLCEKFKFYSGRTIYSNKDELDHETIYGHCLHTVYHQMAVRWHRQSGLGYGYFSMQSGEHVNKTFKIMFKSRTNGKFSDSEINGYDSFAACLHINKMRFVLHDLRKTKGETRRIEKLEFLK